ncbi:hypothetical protein [Methylobacterium soli]|uniref:ASCH domain-containing protein n=1 Tax=Methylobacterium soli TaxID=553447 RepID=A0A6L3STB1_9HYPH|nr:hypothetical protein [Methylobacterium soli]KAB1076672.1 hypothetical protein F6X53_22535 [Methylobacterium soli]GJE44863.1 hypothetical protein AEGHOMDF_4054 [Methylobacterium soli]
MSDRPIIFSAPMVRALLAGRKTQTRRLVRFPGWAAGIFTDPLKIVVETDERGRDPEVICESTGCLAALPLPYTVGDRLYVREAWAPLDALTHGDPGAQALAERGFYRADEGTVEGEIARWRPSIHMPRWASRLTLVVTDVRVERLQDISEADSKAEGVEPICDHGVGNEHLHRIAFEQLWERLHGKGSWLANPWIAAISFSVHRANIDALLREVAA